VLQVRGDQAELMSSQRFFLYCRRSKCCQRQLARELDKFARETERTPHTLLERVAIEYSIILPFAVDLPWSNTQLGRSRGLTGVRQLDPLAEPRRNIQHKLQHALEARR
jgi:hypothetical protein